MNVRNRLISPPPWVLAGWLFADLLLVLFVVALSTTQGEPHTAATRPGAHPSPTASAGHSYPFGLDPHSIPIQIQNVDYSTLFAQGAAGAEAQSILQQVDAGLAAQQNGRRPVGFIIINGDAPEDRTEIGRGFEAAQLVAEILQRYQPQFTHCIPDPGWHVSSNEGTISLTVFFDNV